MAWNKLAYLMISLVVITILPKTIPSVFATQTRDERVVDLAHTCSACHGENGIGNLPNVPHLAGQNAAYLEKSFRAYASGERENDLMQALASNLSSDDILSLSLYYAALPSFASVSRDGVEPYVASDPFALARPEIELCAGCHGDDGNSHIENTPSLAGQGQSYLALTMKAYRDSTRSDGAMQYFTERMDDELINNIALYYSRLTPKRSEVSWRGDPFGGQAPAEHCAACHGSKGNNITQTMGRIAGQDASYIEASMLAYLDGSRDHISMQEILTSLNPVEISNIAAYFASQVPLITNNTRPLTASGWAGRCNRCHGPNGDSQDSNIPKLAGQNETYLVKVLKYYHLGTRTEARMMAMSYILSEREILDLAAYYARMSAADR